MKGFESYDAGKIESKRNRSNKKIVFSNYYSFFIEYSSQCILSKDVEKK